MQFNCSYYVLQTITSTDTTSSIIYNINNEVTLYTHILEGHTDSSLVDLTCAIELISFIELYLCG